MFISELFESDVGGGMNVKIEAHGIRGMDRKPWRKIFKSSDAMLAWAEKYDAEIYATRELDAAEQSLKSRAFREATVPAAPGQKTGIAGQARGTDKAPFRNKLVGESAEGLAIGDPVIITGNVQFKGTTGDIVDFGRDKRFVVVNLYNHGKHSFHSSDVSYNDYADSDEEEARMYDQGDFRDDFTEALERTPDSGAPDFQKPLLPEFNDTASLRPGMLANHGLLGNVKIGKIIGDEFLVVPLKHNPTGKTFKVSRSSLAPGPAKEIDEDSNPQDIVTLDIPLLIRLFEYAREDAKTDMDLHNVAENLIKLSSESGKTLSMADYDAIIGGMLEALAPRKGSVAYNAAMQRKKQAQSPEAVKRTEKIGNQNHQIGTAKVIHRETALGREPYSGRGNVPGIASA